jgi:hypothetical protein
MSAGTELVLTLHKSPEERGRLRRWVEGGGAAAEFVELSREFRVGLTDCGVVSGLGFKFHAGSIERLVGRQCSQTLLDCSSCGGDLTGLQSELYQVKGRTSTAADASTWYWCSSAQAYPGRSKGEALTRQHVAEREQAQVDAG